MLLGSKYTEIKKNVWRTLYHFKCDFCNADYYAQSKPWHRNRLTHYCCNNHANEAQRKGGILDQIRKEGFQKRLGVDYPQQSKKVRQNSINACLQKYGVENVQQVHSIKQQSCETFLNTMKGRGLWISKSEDLFFEKLNDHYLNDIIRQKYLKGVHRFIDFYIPSLDTYIQFDGSYWHGLDRPIEELKNSDTPMDKKILNGWMKDRKLDEYCQEMNIKLIHITDDEFEELS
jgi:hypothetical protein